MKKSFVLLFILCSLALFGSRVKRISAFQTNSQPAYQGHAEDKWANEKLKSLSLEEKIGQFFMLASWPNQSEEHQQEIEGFIKNQHIGGIIFFQGTKEQLKSSITRFQGQSKVPLLCGIDAEWGLSMRLNDAERFPYAYTIGAANDTLLTEKLAEAVAQECREVGIHLNFAPVADVNSNPKNPVIGFRSFGENPYQVAAHVAAFVKGLEQNGILSCVKHFPGHGDTDKDSHYELPTLTHSLEHFHQTEFPPFVKGMQVGTSAVMIGHLNVPSLDESGVPSSLSPKIIKDILQRQLNFKGLVISDALNMKAVSDKYGKKEVVVKAFEAGNDILLFPENVTEAIQAIVDKVKSGEISESEIDQRCLKILKAKAHVIQFKPTKKISNGQLDWYKRATYEKAFTLLKNEKNQLPFVSSSEKIAIVSVGVHVEAFQQMAKKFHDVDVYHFYTFEEAAERMKAKIGKYDQLILSVHPKSVTASANYHSPGKLDSWYKNYVFDTPQSLVLFGNPLLLEKATFPTSVQSIVLGYENTVFAQSSLAQALFGAEGINGKLAYELNAVWKSGDGIELKSAKRLKYSQAEEIGLREEDFSVIDQLVEKGLKAKAYPGCQVLVAVEGKIIYTKNFGTVSYLDTTPVNDAHIYDIASISKIVGSTAALMRLQTQQKFSLNHYVKDYIPEWVENSPVGSIYIKNMMAHQAGFTPWIAFYKATVSNGVLNPEIYSETRKPGYETPVATNLWIKNTYERTIYQSILSTPLAKKPSYEYSDLGYYFAKKIIEKQSGFPLDQFMYREFWDPMGLKNMRYQPLLFFPKERIVPTENDTAFRQRLIHGFVHDPGAAMLGGVGGHAGIFSNATDLAAMMQLYLNKGFYGNRQYISPEVVKEYTSKQFKGNRRGAGFDRPTDSRKDGPTCGLVSLESFGHSGFTGTFTWADPVYGLNYVFLSNRVNPDASNKKIQEMHIRADIQKAIYLLLMKREVQKKES